MSRYVFTHTVGESCEVYLESTADEDMADCHDGVISIEFTGNGYLHFWKRCKETLAQYERLMDAAKDNPYAESLGIDVPDGEQSSVITDLWYDEEKRI